MDKEDLLETIKNKMIEYNKRVMAEHIISYFLLQHGYASNVNTHNDLRIECSKLVKNASKLNIDIPLEYFNPNVNIDRIDIKKVFIVFCNNEINYIKNLRSFYNPKENSSFEDNYNNLINLFIDVYKEISQLSNSITDLKQYSRAK